MTKLTFIAAGLIAISFGSASQSVAQDREPTHAVLSIRKVDFSDQDDVKSFYSKLVTTAHDLCNSDMDRFLSAVAEDRACEAETISKTIASLNKPLLNEVAGIKTREYHATSNTVVSSNMAARP